VNKLLLLIFFISTACLCSQLKNQSHKPIHAVFAHGFWDYPDQVKNYKDFFSFLLRAFSFPEVKSGWINPLKTNMAQEGDIQELESQCVGLQKVILVGLSRGGSTIFTYLGTREHNHVKAAVIESPFDTLEAVVDSLICKRACLGWVPGLARFAKFCLPSLFRGYRRNGVKPIDVVHNIRADLPILIICSLQDTLVPASSSIKLYKRLRETGHNHTYLLLLEHGILELA